MHISRPTQEAVKKLALAMVEEPEHITLADVELTGGFRQGAFPRHLQEVAGDETLLIAGEDLRLYSVALERLAREKEMEHLTARDIDKDLWDFTCELFVERRRYRDDRTRARRIRQLLDGLRRPWQDYEVIASVDHMTLGVRRLDVVGTSLRPLSRQAVTNWGLQETDLLRQFAESLIGKTVAVTMARAGSANRAAEKGAEAIDDALHSLRAVLVGCTRVRIHDERLLFRRGSALAVKTCSTGEIDVLQWRRLFEPIQLEVRTEMAEAARGYLKPINVAIAGVVSERLRSHLQRALHWIGTSITRETYDDKVVDLCTALETLLTVKSDANKGAAIALRSMLLPLAHGGGFFNPAPLYELYDLRSTIVHGSDLRVCGQRDYWHLLSIATLMVTDFVELASRNGSVTSPTTFIDGIETQESLSEAIAWLESDASKVHRAIAKFAHERLKVLEQASS